MVQTSQILQQYFKKNTVTNIKFTKNVIDTLPGITICYDRLFSLDKLVARFPEYEGTFRNYTKFFSKLSKYKKNNETEIIEELKVYENSYVEIINTKLKRLTIEDLFDNLTISFNERYKFKDSIITNVHGDISTAEMFSYKNNSDGSKEYHMTLPPIESINWKDKQKCFTFFSSLQLSFRTFKANINKISVGVNFPRHWFPWSTMIHLAIHAPNVSPTPDTFFDIQAASWNRIYFSKIENYQLDNYAKCHNYEQGDFRMRSDCIIACSQDSTGCKDTILQRKILLRKEHFQNFAWNKSCSNTNRVKVDSLKKSCAKKCKENCYQAYYMYEEDLNPKRFNTIMDKIINDRIDINFEPSSKPNLVIYHHPEMPFLSLVCNFGGLVGMLLGTSLLAVLCHLWVILKQIIIKHILVKLNVNFHKKNEINIFCPEIKPQYMSRKYRNKQSISTHNQYNVFGRLNGRK